MRCLVLGKDEIVAEAISAILEDIGHSVERVWSGQEAISCFQAGGFDLVLIDGQDQADIARTIKGAEPSTHVVLVTGNLSLLEADGVDLIVHKPFSEDDLKMSLPPGQHGGRRMTVYVRGLNDQAEVIEHGRLVFEGGIIRAEGSDVVHKLLSDPFPAWLKRDDPESWPLAYHASRLWCSVAEPHE